MKKVLNIVILVLGLLVLALVVSIYLERREQEKIPRTIATAVAKAKEKEKVLEKQEASSNDTPKARFRPVNLDDDNLSKDWHREGEQVEPNYVNPLGGSYMRIVNGKIGGDGKISAGEYEGNYKVISPVETGLVIAISNFKESHEEAKERFNQPEGRAFKSYSKVAFDKIFSSCPEGAEAFPAFVVNDERGIDLYYCPDYSGDAPEPKEGEVTVSQLVEE